MIDDENIRHTTIDNYVLIYEISDETKQINILRFVYAKKNLINIAVKWRFATKYGKVLFNFKNKLK